MTDGEFAAKLCGLIGGLAEQVAGQGIARDLGFDASVYTRAISDDMVCEDLWVAFWTLVDDIMEICPVERICDYGGEAVRALVSWEAANPGRRLQVPAPVGVRLYHLFKVRGIITRPPLG